MLRQSNNLIFVLFFILASCETNPQINLGFDSTVGKFSDGMIIAEIKGSNENLYLHGKILLFEGELSVKLLNANGIPVYSKVIKAPVDFRIYETFFAEPGYWKLTYKSNQGVGEIDLHLRN